MNQFVFINCTSINGKGIYWDSTLPDDIKLTENQVYPFRQCESTETNSQLSGAHQHQNYDTSLLKTES